MNTSRTITEPDHGTPDAHARTERTAPRCVRGASRRRVLDERGQTTAEYALVLIAAATIAMLIVAWAANTGAIDGFFDAVIDRITNMMP